ncbi:MAG: hypothetical protein LBV15_04920 [Planctomycetota bacterium]|jgi:hypothetical protein|nr:hypothetical protein [Planctomycetota bacterium]
MKTTAKERTETGGMDDGREKWEREWELLLSRARGGDRLRPEFRDRLLTRLKERLGEVRASAEAAEEENWRRLLSVCQCRPAPEFRASLWERLRARQRETAGVSRPEDGEENALRAMFAAYVPVSPRPKFSDNLLNSLKERQRQTVGSRRVFRRQAIFFSLVSTLAAACYVLIPIISFNPLPGPGPEAARPPILVDVSPISDLDYEAPETASAVDAMPLPASLDGFSAEDLFQGRLLPAKVWAVELEMSGDGGWHPLETGRELELKAGQAFRPDPRRSGSAALAFADGSYIALRDGAVLEATERGFSVQRGALAAEVPAGSSDRLFLHFPERDIAVRPGTSLAVNSAPPEAYAEGGAPAPRVAVSDGGLAVARGKYGSGALLANHVYDIDSYVSPELPGRGLCLVECEDLERQFPAAPFADSARLVSGGGGEGGVAAYGLSEARRQSYRSSPAPAGFRKVGDRWLADSYDHRPAIRIKYLSDAYFALADRRRDLAAALALGPEVVINGGGGEFFEIHR